jgi:transposase
MATSIHSKTFLRLRRVFSKSIKQSIVRDIERGKCTVIEASRELNVSERSIYNWIYSFSRHLVKNRVMVVEDKSESYRSQELEKKIKELEAALGRKQLELDFLNKIIESANAEYHTDLKKNSERKSSVGINKKKEKNTGTK